MFEKHPIVDSIAVAVGVGLLWLLSNDKVWTAAPDLAGAVYFVGTLASAYGAGYFVRVGLTAQQDRAHRK
jgi:hypothetical protein